MGLKLSWLTVRMNLDHSVQAAVRCWLCKVEFAAAGSAVCQDLPLDMPLVELIGSYSDVWRCPLHVSVLGWLGRDSGTDQCWMLPVTHPEWRVWSYKAIHSLWLALLEFCVSGKDWAAHQGQLPPAPSWKVGQQKIWEIHFFLPLSASCLLDSVTTIASEDIWFAWGRFSVSSHIKDWPGEEERAAES